MRKLCSGLVCFSILMIGLSGCSHDESATLSTQNDPSNTASSVDAANPLMLETGPGYAGSLSTREVLNCSLSIPSIDVKPQPETLIPLNYNRIWDPSVPAVNGSSWYKQIQTNIKSGDLDAIGEVSLTLLRLLQTYHPDQVGMGLYFDTTNNQSGISLVGNGKSTEMTWRQVIEQLDIPQDKGALELAELLPETTPKVQVTYVENSTEKLCNAARGLSEYLFRTSYLSPGNYSLTYDTSKDMLNFSQRKGTTNPDGGLLDQDSLPPKLLAEIDETIDVSKLINTKYSGLIYYSEF